MDYLRVEELEVMNVAKQDALLTLFATDLSLTATDIQVLAVFYYQAPGIRLVATLSDRLNTSRRTVERSVARLAKKGLLARKGDSILPGTLPGLPPLVELIPGL